MFSQNGPECALLFLSPLHTAPGLSFRAATLGQVLVGDDRASGHPWPGLSRAIRRRRASERYARLLPSLSFVLREIDHPKRRCMLSVLGSDHVFCLLNFDVFAKIIGCTCARPCPILGPPLLASLIQICALTVRSCSALAPFSLFRSSLGEIFTCLQCLAYCFSTKQLSCGIRAGGIGVRRSNDWLCWVLGLWAFW